VEEDPYELQATSDKQVIAGHNILLGYKNMAVSTEAPTAEMSNLSVNPSAPKGTAKRDALRANELEVQALWEKENVFESDAADDGKEKFIVTFPFPYSNGHLHIGHAFSLTKSVFRAQFERHLGKNVLFPFAFHCTGMPIQAVSFKCYT